MEEKEEEFGVSEFEPANSELIEPEVCEVSVDGAKRKYGRKFLITIITMIIGGLTFLLNVFQHGDDVVSIIGLLVVILSDVSYVITEGKLDLESIKSITEKTEELVDKAEDLYDDCFCEDSDYQEGEEENG